MVDDDDGDQEDEAVAWRFSSGRPWAEKRALAKHIAKYKKAQRLKRLFKRVRRLEKVIRSLQDQLRKKGILNEKD